MNASLPIAVGSIFTECNHLGGKPTDLACFERQELTRGEEIFRQPSGAVAGMLGVLHQRRHVSPLLVASACPGGLLTSECYRTLKTDMLDRLREALPVGGVLLALHGSVAVEDVDDLEGDLLQAVREVVGGAVPIVATLDL